MAAGAVRSVFQPAAVTINAAITITVGHSRETRIILPLKS